MSISPRRNDLLQKRIDGLTAALKGSRDGETKPLLAVRVAAWQLREVLPILAIEEATSAKVAHRVRRMTRRLVKVLEIAAHLRILEGLGDIDRTTRQAVTRVKNELRRRNTKARLPAVQKKVSVDVRRVVKSLEPALAAMVLAEETSAARRDMRWVVKARAARRSATVRSAVEEAGSIYVPGRLRAARRAVRKLRFGLELVGELAGGVSAADLDAIVQTQASLDDIAETESLIKRIRQQQAALAGSEVKAWQELDSLVGAVENRCRRLHGRYMRERATLLSIGARLGARATAAGGAKPERSVDVAAHELYLVRHAIAAEQGDSWPDDSKRPLTDEGIERMRMAARGLDRLGTRLDVVLTSPYVRARQTAEIVASTLESRPPVVTIESLTPNGSFQAVLADIEKQSVRRRIALVGHEPALGELAARLAGIRQPLVFKKGAICRVDVNTIPPAGAGELRWFMTAKILGAIKKS